jgi:hypothetical protein
MRRSGPRPITACAVYGTRRAQRVGPCGDRGHRCHGSMARGGEPDDEGPRAWQREHECEE